jgi:large subunit ribosomal protein L15
MNLSNLTKIVARGKKRVGLGHGSGRMKTSGRGMKGQKARGSIPLDFEGGALPLTKRLPFLRGKGRNKSIKPDPLIINVEKLNRFSKDAIIDITSLANEKLVDLSIAQKNGVKILGDGSLSVAVTVKIPTSKVAAEKIRQAGGTVA